MFCWWVAQVLVLVLMVVLGLTLVMHGGGGDGGSGGDDGAFERILLLSLDVTDFTFFMQL
jgi:hypothetical protein